MGRKLSERHQKALKIIERAGDGWDYGRLIQELSVGLDVTEATAESILKHLARLRYVRPDGESPLGIEVLRNADGLNLAQGATDELGPAQQRALEAIRRLTKEKGHPPTIEELAAALGVAPSRAYELRSKLQNRGRVRVGAGSRAVWVRDEAPSEPAIGSLVYVRMMGRAAAHFGFPAEEDERAGMELPRELIGRNRPDEVFLLEVEGDSMRDAGVLNGDLVLVERTDTARNREMVVAELPGNGEAELTVKYLSLESGRPWLVPMAPGYERIPGDEARIRGRVIGLLRGSIGLWPGG